MAEENEEGQAQDEQPADPEAPQQDAFDDYQMYLDARIAYDVRKAMAQNTGVTAQAVKQGVAAAIAPPPQIPLPDDEFWRERKEAHEWEGQYLVKAAKAEAAGDRKKAQEFREISQFKRDELEALGPSARERAVEDLAWANSFRGVLNLGEAKFDNDPAWESALMRHDAPVEIHRLNSKNTGKNFLVLPREKSEYGDVESVRPSNMVFVELPAPVYESIRREVYVNNPGADSHEKFRLMWAALHRQGYAHSAQPTIEYPKPEVDAEPEEETPRGRDPWSRMTQREFEAAMSKRPNMVKR